jgi:hypothetical protein
VKKSSEMITVVSKNFHQNDQFWDVEPHPDGTLTDDFHDVQVNNEVLFQQS